MHEAVISRGSPSFRRTTKRALLISLALIVSLAMYGCDYGAIAVTSGIIGCLNMLGVFGDGELSDFLGKAALIGTIVGLTWGLVSGFDKGPMDTLGF